MHWSVPTRDTRVAAAMANLRIPVTIKAIHDEPSGREEITFFFQPHSPDGKFVSRTLAGLWRSGKLEASTPAHPFLTGIRSQVNRERILDMSVKGHRFLLTPAAAGAVWTYQPDSAGTLPGVAEGQAVIRTGDLKIVAAFATIGLPILHIRGNRPNFEWFLPPTGPAGEDGIDLLRRLRAPRMEQDNLHPFFLAYDCLVNRERLLDAIQALPRKIHLQAPHSHRRALITAGAPKKEWDEISRFFRG